MIELRETTKGRAPLEEQPRYEVLFCGKLFDTLYFNMTGYCGYLPLPGANGRVGHLDIGERGISAYRKQVAKLNRVFFGKSIPAGPTALSSEAEV
jgi:hypothetical protein